MTELPSGTVTFLFSDIEGSTRLVERLGDRHVEALAEPSGCCDPRLPGSAAGRWHRR
jgi:hypothetical protein